MFKKYLLFVAFAFISATSMAQVTSGDSGVKVTQVLNGAKKLRITRPDVLSDFNEYFTATYKTADAFPTSVEAYTINTYGGLLEADLPDWLKEEVIADNNPDNLSTKPQTLNDLKRGYFDPNILLGNTEGIYLDANLLANINASRQADGCGGYWTDKTKTIGKPRHDKLGYSEPIVSDTQGSTTYSLTANIPAGSDTTSGEIHYQIRRNKCTGNQPYRIRAGKSFLDVNIVDGGSYSLTGNVNYKDTKTLWKMEPKELYDYKYDGWIWWVEIRLEFKVDLNASIDLSAEAAAMFSFSYERAGNLHLRFECDEKGKCVTTTENNLSKLTSKNESGYSVSADVRIIPKVEIGAHGYFSLYYDLIDVEEVAVGVIFEFPMRYYTYKGNTCDDADGDLKNETVGASLIDFSLEVWGAYSYMGIIHSDKSIVLNLPFDKTREIALEKKFHGKSVSAVVYSKSIYFNDMGSRVNSIFDPKTTLTRDNNTAKVTLAKRSCYPFALAPAIYSVDWGDGSANESATAKDVNSPVELTHVLNSSYAPIKVKMTGDTVGRTFDQQDWLTPKVNGGASNLSWLIPVINLILL